MKLNWLRAGSYSYLAYVCTPLRNVISIFGFSRSTWQLHVQNFILKISLEKIWVASTEKQDARYVRRLQLSALPAAATEVASEVIATSLGSTIFFKFILCDYNNS